MADTSAWARANTEEVAPRWREVVKAGELVACAPAAAPTGSGSLNALIAAAAAERGFGVLHYDHHFDTLTTVLTFASQWVAPAGSLD